MKKRMKRVLSLILAVTMVFGMVNTSVFADEDTSDGVYFTKSIVNTSGQPDRLKLEAYTTGVVTSAAENVPTDLVLVLDQSGSMDNALGDSTVLEVMKDAVEEFVGEIAEMNGDSNNYRVAIVGFASESGYNDNTEILTLGQEVEVQNVYYTEVEGELDTSKTYYVRGNYSNNYSAIEYRANWFGDYGWYYVNGYNSSVNIDRVSIYERNVETDYVTELGIPYNTLTANNSGYDFADALIDCTDDEIAGDGIIGRAIDLLEGEGATRTDLGMELAYNILSEAAEAPGYDREQVVVLLTDGVPTSFQDFDSGVANNAVDYAKELKDDGTHIFSMYLGSPGTQAANFLQAVSSNYPDATSISNLGDRAASSYYSAHSESAAIKNVFSQIVSSILSDSQLNESSVITDEISDYFRLPYITGEEYDLDQIQVYTVDFLGGDDFSEDGNWDDDEVPFDTAKVELSDDGKTIQVTGFNFAYHCITEEAKTTSTRALDYGRKLVIYIPIVPDGSTDSFGGYLPTNEDAEIIHGETTVAWAESRYADVTINYDLEPAERAYHVDGTYLDQAVEYTFSYEANMDSILNEMITGEPDDESDLRIPDGKNNAGVDMVYRLYDIGTDDRDSAEEGNTGDDTLVATLTVEAGEKIDVTDASKWDWVDDEVTITIPAEEYFAEKVYVLVCTLTSTNPDEDPADSLMVYDFLDVAVVRGELAHLVYGTIDEDGTVEAEDRYPNDENNDKGTGSVVGGTYTEAVIEGHNSDTMIFTTKEGYEIEFIRVLTTETDPYDTWTTIYHADRGAVMAEGYDEIEKINNGLQETWSVYAENVTKGIAFEVSTRPLVFTLDTTADEGARVTDDTTFSYSATETLDVFFSAKAGYYLDKVVVNNTVYTAEHANDSELAEEYGLHITGTATSWVQDGDGNWNKQTVITGGTIDLAKIKNYEVEVYTKKQVHQVVYNYYVREYDSQTGISYTDWENRTVNPTVAYVTYGEELPLPDPTTGDETQIKRNGEEDNYTLSEWYDTHNGEDFYGITDLTAVIMGAADLDYHAYWAKNPSVKSALTIQKNVTGAHTADETFTFRAMFHEDLVGIAEIEIPANSADPVSQKMEVTLTDSQADLFKAGNGAIYIYEVAGTETNYWQYDTSIYAVRWDSELGEAIIWLNGEPVLDENGDAANVVNFTNKMIAESDLMVSGKVLVGNTENVKVGDTLTWEITVVNNGYADGVLTADMINDEVLYKDADGKFVSFDPVQKATITTALPLTVPARGSITLTATWVVPDAAEGKIIKNTAKINGDDPEESEEVEVEQPDLKVEKRLTKVGDTVIEYDAEGNRITTIPVVDPTDGSTVPLEWTIIVTNEGEGPGKFTLTDTLVKSDMQAPYTVEKTGLTVSPAAAQDGYYTVSADDSITLTVTYTVTEDDAHHRLVNTVEIKEHDDPTDPDDPDKKDESDPVDVAPYTVVYTYTGTLIPVGAAEKLPAATQHEFQELVDVADIPAVDGYTFYGWNTDDLPETKYQGGDTFVITGHVVFEGRWEEEYSELMVVDKVLTAVNGKAVTADTVIKVGDILTWKIEVVNSGTGVGYVTESNLDDQVLYLDGSEWKVFTDTAEVLPEGQTEWPDAPGVAVAARGGKATFVATWTVPYEAEGKTIMNFAKVGDGDGGKETPEVKVEQPDLKVEKRVTKVGSTVIKYDDNGNRTTKIPEVDPEDGTNVNIEWTIIVTNEGKGPGKFTLTDVLVKVDMEDFDAVENKNLDVAPATQDGFYTVPANDTLILTANYTVTSEDAHHRLVNTVELKEHDDPTDPDDPDKKDESDPVEVAPYTVTYVDGVDNEVVFDDQVNPKLKHGVATPKFQDLDSDPVKDNRPVREGYDFIDWKPLVANKVTGNATYVAQWTKVDPKLHVTHKRLVRVRDADHNLKKASDPIVVGDYLIWEVTVENRGNGDGVVTAADFEDIVYYKDGETWVPFDTRATMLPDKASVWPTGGITVKPGLENKIVVLAVWQVPASAEGKTIKNAAKLNGPDDPKESEEIEVAEPKVTIEKTVAKVGEQKITDATDIPTAQVGDTIEWTITVTNEGDAPGKFKLVDQLNGTAGKVTITGNHRADANGYYTIPAKTTTGWTFTATYEVVEADKGAILKNVVTADDGDPNKPDPTDESEEVPVEADLAVKKTVSKINDKTFVKGMYAEVGDTIEWTIVVSNNGKTEGKFKLVDVLTGAGAADAKVTITTDAVADQDGYYTIAGKTGEQPETMTFTATYEVVEGDKNSVLQNEVRVDDGDKDPEDDPEDKSDPVPVEPKLTVVKTVKSIVSGGVETAYASGMIAKEGDTVKWTITVTNESDAVGKFKLVDLLNDETGKVTIVGYENTVDSEGFYNIPAKTAEGHTVWEFTATYTVTAEDKGTTLTNKVTLDDGDPNDDPDPTDEADPVPVEDPDPAKLTVIKTIATIGGKTVEYNADGTVKTKAKVGERIYWNITVTNVGEVATTVTVKDILTVVHETTGKREVPTVIVDALPLKAGETRTIPNAFHYDVQEGDLTVQNVAVAETDDDDPSNPGTTPEITVEDPKLEAIKTVDRTAAKVGETIIYTIKVKNTGNVDLVNVTIKENFSGDLNKITVTESPAGTRFSAADGIFMIPSLKVDGEATIVFTYVPEVVGKLTNAVVVTGKTEDDTDPTDDPIDETDPTETEVTEQDKPGIDVEKTVNDTTVEVGDKVIYTIKVTNTGNVKLVNVVVDESGFGGNFGKITDITKSADDVTVDLDNEKFVIADMNPGEVVEITFSYKTTEKGKLENTVVVTGKPENDTDPTDDPTDEDEAPDVTVDDDDTPITPVGPTPELDKGGDHLSYIIGYPDGTVQPMGTITRAEVATIFFRLLTDESRAYYWSQENNFSDVAVTDWFNNAVSTMAAAGIVNGYPDGTFRPQDPVSRAEFAAIATRFTEEGRDGVSQKYFKQYFKDVNKDDWFAAAVELAYELGWAQGYEGSYRPEDDMTRAEVMTMVNRIMEREVEADDMLDDMIFWPDNLPEAWYYEAVQEATNSHTYKRTNKKVPNLDFYYEEWKKLIENPDWAALERSWSDANSQN